MKRSRDMIMSKILNVCIGGACKTKIVYQANLNFRTVGPYLELLTTRRNINATTKSNLVVYETTARWLDLLNNFKQIQNVLSWRMEPQSIKV
ncbi:Winged helix-turn-helix [uncultured archaeon]|nr:Winged helix-turn-helix [uncultured archaeon]